MGSDANDAADALERRIASLESAVRELTAEVERLRPQRSAASPPSSSEPPFGRAERAPHPMAPRSPLTLPPELWPANWLPRNVDIESLVGRYGTLILATISALAAVGIFLGWAIENGLLGPKQRIGLGLIVAAALAVGGLRLRRRERSFGASLLGLSLAITQVCAWGAGPSLHIVPEWAAFLLAAATSIGLAVFAHREADEPLWSVGFSGASIAPFVTSSGKGNVVLLTAYGVAVLASAGYAMGPRRWLVAGRLFLLSALVYTVALAASAERDSGPLLAIAFPLAVAVGGVLPWVGGWSRRERLRALGVLAVGAALRVALAMGLQFTRPMVAAMVAAAGVVWLVLVDRTHAVAEPPPGGAPQRSYEGDWLDAAVLPLGFVAATVTALDGTARESGLVMGGSAAILLATVVRSQQGSLRDGAVFATVLCALIAVLLLERGRPLAIGATIAALSAICFAANLVWSSPSWTTLGALGLVWSALASLNHLARRTPYAYAPFATQPSAVALLVLACFAAAQRLTREAKLERLLRGAVVVWGFLWVHQEIAFAYNRTTATLLRVTYYAATSVAAVGIGRARNVALLRHVGLGLAVLAAGTALFRARELDAVAARIGADLVAAVFLLAIAYWYRRPGTGEEGRLTVPPSPP